MPGWTIATLLAAMEARGEKDALVRIGSGAAEVWSHSELAGAVRALASTCLANGIAPGEPVFILGPNSPEWVILRLALGAVGAVPVLADHTASDADILAAFDDSGCRRAFAAADLVCKLEATRRRVTISRLDGICAPSGAGRWNPTEPDARTLPPVESSAPAMMVYTSGTTGRPKSFTLSYANLGANLEAIVASATIGAADRVLLPLPLHHVYPFLIGLLVPLQCGAAVVLPAAATGPEIRQALADGRVTVMVGVPRLYSAMLDGIERHIAATGRIAGAAVNGGLAAAIWVRSRLGIDLGRPLFGPLRRGLGAHLRLLVSGGAKLEDRVLWRLVGLGWTVRSGYGLAETASTFTGNLPGHERLGSEGRPFQGGRLRIADPDDHGIGEIQLHGPNMFGGYRDNPDANAAAFTADGWFRTGDLGRVDGEGFLYVTGRVKELIALGGGKNVFPEEIERVYGTSPYIREIAVLERGGQLVALVVPDLDAIRAGGNAHIADVLRIELAVHGAGLPAYRRVSGFAVRREPLPRTRLGKCQRFLLPELYERAKAGPRPAVASPTEADKALLAHRNVAAAWRILQDRYRGCVLSLDAHPQLDVGIDSLEWMALSLDLERRLGLRLGEADIAEADSIRDLLRAVSVARTDALPSEQSPSVAPLRAYERRVGACLHMANRLFVQGWFGLHIEGIGNMPSKGPFVLIANHVSDLDPLVLAAALPPGLRAEVRWGADAPRVFAQPVLCGLARAFGAFPVDERMPAATLAAAAGVLREGAALVWFPESWRSPDGELQPFRPGIGALLQRAVVPVVPAHIAGTFAALPRGRRFPRRHPIRIRIGLPIPPERYLSEGDAQGIADFLQQRIAALDI